MAAGNYVEVTGNITSDPELKITPGGTSVVRFGMAWNRKWQQDGEWQEEAHFFDVTAWRDLAENIAESFIKGDRVVVSGRLEQSRWEDKATGENRSKVGIVADDVAASVRWATVEITRVEREDSGGRGGRSGGSRDGGGSRRGGGDRGRPASRGNDRYADEEPF
jgi:single-strand DNA-binding protein